MSLSLLCTETPFHQQLALFDVLISILSGVLRILFANLANGLRSVWKEILLVKEVKKGNSKDNKGDGLLAGKLV